jgi:hypothetical protein
MITLDDNLRYFTLLNGSQELAVCRLHAGLLRLVKHVEQKNDHEADDQPKG